MKMIKEGLLNIKKWIKEDKGAGNTCDFEN